MSGMTLTEHLVNFRGDQIVSVMDPDGKALIPVKRMCEAIGISHQMQQKKIKADPKFNWYVNILVAEDGKQRKLLCIDVDDVEGWLLSINPSRVKASVRDKLVLYHRECMQALHDYWAKGAAVNPRAAAGDLDIPFEAIKKAMERALEEVVVPEIKTVQNMLVSLLTGEGSEAEKDAVKRDLPLYLSKIFNSLGISYPSATNFAQEFGKFDKVKALARGKRTTLVGETVVEANAYFMDDWNELYEMASKWLKTKSVD